MPSRLSSPHTPPVTYRSSPTAHAASSSPLASPFLSAFSPSSPHIRSSSFSSRKRPVVSSTPPVLPTITPISLSFRIESPPLVLYGKPSESTGTLLSGLFTLDVLESVPFPMKSVYMALIQEVKTLKPQHSACKDCLNHKTELARWDVLTHPAMLPKASHAYPFSHLVPGSIPASTSNNVFSVSYRLTAVAVPDNTKHNIKDPANPDSMMQFPNFVYNRPLNIQRSIIRGPDRNSVRVFPPTDLVAQITIPSTVFPDSGFPFEMVLEGIASSNGDANRQTRWRMRKLNWRIDETCKIKAFRCPAHLHVPFHKALSPSQSRSRSRSSRPTRGSSANSAAHPSPLQGSGAAPTPGSPEEFFIEDVKCVGSGERKEGWKTDFSGKGKVELLDEYNSTLSKTSCDIDDPTFGLSTSHILFVEMVVAEEAITPRSKQVLPTGAARVLRMQFNLNMTARSGLGIAWDDEVPPTYADVPLSPPEYQDGSQLPALEDVILAPHEARSINIEA